MFGEFLGDYVALLWNQLMAHSSSDSCNSAPEVIDEFSSDNDKTQDPTFRCPLCLRNSTVFYCEICIRNGSFTHSLDRRLERFADKKLKLFRLKEKKEKLIRQYHELLSRKVKLENLKLSVALCRESNRHLRAIMGQLQDRIKIANVKTLSLQKKNEHWYMNKFKLTDKLSSMNKLIEFHKLKFTESSKELNKVIKEIKSIRRENIQELIDYIFPISKVKAPKTFLRDYLDPDEHTESVYIVGQWELAGKEECDFQYSIIESCLPANGNYSAYVDWTTKFSDEMPLTDEDACLRDAAYGIITALSFTAHLVTVLCFYLDAHVPKRLSHSEFWGSDLDVHLFQHKVAKLNADVIHLCLSQNVDPIHLRPHHTMDNLLLLFDPTVSDLGRSGPMDVEQRLPEDMEDYLGSELLLNADDDLPPDMEVITETEEVEDIVVHQFGTLVDQAQYQPPKPSLTSDLISSVASIWKAATWQK